MASIQVLKTLTLAKGVTLEIRRDDAEPESSKDRYIVEVVATGDEGADVLYVPPHWHKYHSEYMTVIEGRLEVTLNGEIIIAKPGDAPVLIPRRAVHSIRSFKGEKLVMREQAEPAGDYKALFFNDLLSGGGFGSFAKILRVFYDGDTYLALPLYFRFIDEAFLTIFGGIAHLLVAPKPQSL